MVLLVLQILRLVLAMVRLVLGTMIWIDLCLKYDNTGFANG